MSDAARQEVGAGHSRRGRQAARRAARNAPCTARATFAHPAPFEMCEPLPHLHLNPARRARGQRTRRHACARRHIAGLPADQGHDRQALARPRLASRHDALRLHDRLRASPEGQAARPLDRVDARRVRRRQRRMDRAPHRRLPPRRPDLGREHRLRQALAQGRAARPARRRPPGTRVARAGRAAARPGRRVGDAGRRRRAHAREPQDEPEPIGSAAPLRRTRTSCCSAAGPARPSSSPRARRSSSSPATATSAAPSTHTS